MSDGIISAGSRKLQPKGNSLAVTLPKEEMEKKLDLDPDEIVGEFVTVKLDDGGTCTVELGPLKRKKRAISGSD